MPKKSTAARQAHAARRSQTAAKSQNVALVRSPSGEASADTPSTEIGASSVAALPSGSTSAASAPQPASSTSRGATRTATASRPVTSARPAATKPAAKPSTAPQGSHAVREQEKRVARAREMRRVRQANVVTPEHFRYVIHDLRLTGILAAAMFTIIVVLHFVLG